jgi:hypothetical protein
MPLSGVDGSKFNMKINLYVVSLDEHNVPRVERIQTTKDTKVLNTICLYYRIFFFSLQELCCPFNFVKKKIVNYVYPLLRPGVCFSPFSLVTGETCRKNEGLVVTGQVSTKTFIFPAVSKHSKSSTFTACHLPKTARHYTPLGTQVPVAHACAIELSFGATTIFSRHSRHISSKTRRIGKPLRKRGHILHRVGMIL